MSPEQAMDQLNRLLAHAWMVRTFLKHAEEIQEHEAMLEVHRTIFDCVRAVEPSYQRRDAKEFLRRLSGKLPKLRRAAETLAREYRTITDHTNFQMASISLTCCIDQLAAVLAQVDSASPAGRSSEPIVDSQESAHD